MNLLDYFQFGQQNMQPVVKRMLQDRAGDIAASLAASQNYHDPRLGDPNVQDALGAMMAADKGQLGLTTGKLGNELTTVKILEALSPTYKSGPGGMIYDPHTGDVKREPTVKPLGYKYGAVGNNLFNRETGELTPTNTDPLKSYSKEDADKIRMASDTAVHGAKIAAAAAGKEWTPDEEQRVRDEAEFAAKKRLVDQAFAGGTKATESSLQRTARELKEHAEKDYDAAQKRLDAQDKNIQNFLLKNPTKGAAPDGMASARARLVQELQDAKTKLEQRRKEHEMAIQGGDPYPVIQGGNGGAVLPAPGAVDLPVLTPEQARGLLPGTPFRGHDGRTYTR